MHNIAIFASGNGTNAENIARYFAGNDEIRVKCVLSNSANAGVHERMAKLGVKTATFDKAAWNDAMPIVDYLREEEVDFVVLAGFLCFVRMPILDAYKGRIINIHPSLLPKFGGKGMWGMNVHNAVIEAGEKESGITIHYVDADVDGGAVIMQAKCEVLPEDTPEMLAQRVHSLEYAYFPEVIESLVRSL